MSKTKIRNGFGLYPSVRFNRSMFDMSHGNKTSFNLGELVPIDIQEVLPGDSFKQKTTAVIRTTSPFIKPIMDNMYADVYSFFVPKRLVYDDFEKVFGNPNPSAYIDNDLETIPTVNVSNVASGNLDYVAPYTVGDYLGLPVETDSMDGASISLLPFRAFALIYDKWFRNENVTDEMYIHKGETANSESFNNNDWSPNNYLGKLPKVTKKKDYFTSALPQPQKGQSVPITGLVNGLPVTYIDGSSPIVVNGVGTTDHYLTATSNNGLSLLSATPEPTINPSSLLNLSLVDSNGFPILQADTSNASWGNVNDLRYAFALQRMLERDALYGSRYNEMLLGHFGVVSPDSRLQLPEFLGGGRIPISIQQVNSTASINEVLPLASEGAFSLSSGQVRYSKGFVEHGYVITVMCVRQMHSYQQGIAKFWTRTSRNDFYDPLFANLGEQPIYQSEIFYNGGETNKDVFGYNEAWADYRYKPSMITGGMRRRSSSGLDIWHLADYYFDAPVLSSGFIAETNEMLEERLSVTSNALPNFIADIWFDCKAIRVMPTYSVPGLIDHH